jgi:hypothetical protein
MIRQSNAACGKVFKNSAWQGVILQIARFHLMPISRGA